MNGLYRVGPYPGRVLLCGPISDRDDWNEPAFAEAASRLRSVGFNVTNPHELHDGDHSMPWDFYMTATLGPLLAEEIATVVLLPGWLDSRGARIEHKVAEEMGVRCVEYADILANGLC